MTRAMSVTAPRRQAMGKRSEKEIQVSILALLRARGVVCWKAGAGAFRVTDASGRERYVKMGHTGVADIIGVLPIPYRDVPVSGRPFLCTTETIGRFIAVEVKVPGKDATPEQAAFLTSVRQAGGLGFVAHSCEEVAKALGWTP